MLYAEKNRGDEAVLSARCMRGKWDKGSIEEELILRHQLQRT